MGSFSVLVSIRRYFVVLFDEEFSVEMIADIHSAYIHAYKSEWHTY